MNDVMVQAPTSPERLESELNPQPSGRRRLGIIGASFPKRTAAIVACQAFQDPVGV